MEQMNKLEDNLKEPYVLVTMAEYTAFETLSEIIKSLGTIVEGYDLEIKKLICLKKSKKEHMFILINEENESLSNEDIDDKMRLTKITYQKRIMKHIDELNEAVEKYESEMSGLRMTSNAIKIEKNVMVNLSQYRIMNDARKYVDEYLGDLKRRVKTINWTEL